MNRSTGFLIDPSDQYLKLDCVCAIAWSGGNRKAAGRPPAPLERLGRFAAVLGTGQVFLGTLNTILEISWPFLGTPLLHNPIPCCVQM